MSERYRFKPTNVFRYNPNDFQFVGCPICCNEHVHIECPVFEEGNDNYETDSGYRGDFIRIPFWCESGHSFELCLAFHKGTTYSWMQDADKDYYALRMVEEIGY